MSLLIKNIKGLVQVREEAPLKLSGSEMAHLPILENAWLLLVEDKIHSFGPMSQVDSALPAQEVIDASGRYVFPAFVDSHTHLVFAGSREREFVDKISGLSYEEIAKKGGGILNSASRLRQTSEEELLAQTLPRAWEIIGFGTGTVEIKSGYGLTVDDELKMLRVAKRIGELTPLKVRTTLLGAHAVPREAASKEAYLRLVMEEMIPRAAEEGLAHYVDVFCEKGFFTFEDTVAICEKGKAYGLIPRIHANQLSLSGGVQAGVQCGAISVDHLEVMGEAEIAALQGSDTMPVALPGAAFYLGTEFPPARKMLQAGLPLAIATDYNPGSAPCGKMAFMLSLACIKMKMTPEEAINAATINTAYTLQMGKEVGSITPGKSADVWISAPMPSVAFLPYAFGSNLVDTVILEGKVVVRQGQAV
jgi:imidazolonepropionase